MPYQIQLAEQIRKHLAQFPRLKVEEKKMFRGVVFMVNGKMCINISGARLMCRFDPALMPEISQRTGFLPMIMRGKTLDGYCYVEPEGFQKKPDFDYWMGICLDFNKKAKKSKK